MLECSISRAEMAWDFIQGQDRRAMSYATFLGKRSADVILPLQLFRDGAKVGLALAGWLFGCWRRFGVSKVRNVAGACRVVTRVLRPKARCTIVISILNATTQCDPKDLANLANLES
jgi:hypothetical protein